MVLDVDKITELLAAVENGVCELEKRMHRGFDGVGRLLGEEVRCELQPLEEKIDQRFNELFENFDALFRRDEKREHEYLAMRSQIARLHERVDALERKTA